MNKNEILRATLDILVMAYEKSEIKTKRNASDYFIDKIRQAASSDNLQSMFEMVSKLMESSVGLINYIGKDKFGLFCKASAEPEANAVLQWIRENPFLTVMTCLSKKKYDDNEKKFFLNPEYENIINSFEIKDYKQAARTVSAPSSCIEIEAKCLSSLAHGSDTKMGNATGFRTYKVMSDTTDEVLELPAYSGNALRGVLRDELADHFLKSIGITPNSTRPPVNLWFFHVLYEGGALRQSDTATKKVNSKLGKDGKLDMAGLYEFRENIPIISLLGSAVGNRILEGKIYVNNLRPVCYEWGFDTDIRVASLCSWEFITRHMDSEEYEEHTGMIANTEVLKTGTVLIGGINLNENISQMEISALVTGLNILKHKGYLGAQNARGLGQVEINYKFGDCIEGATEDAYIKYLSENKDRILDYMREIGALNDEK